MQIFFNIFHEIFGGEQIGNKSSYQKREKTFAFLAKGFYICIVIVKR
jgi:hypothetical protein